MGEVRLWFIHWKDKFVSCWTCRAFCKLVKIKMRRVFLWIFWFFVGYHLEGDVSVSLPYGRFLLIFFRFIFKKWSYIKNLIGMIDCQSKKTVWNLYFLRIKSNRLSIFMSVSHSQGAESDFWCGEIKKDFGCTVSPLRKLC